MTSKTSTQHVLIDGQWREADHSGTFQATNPNNNEKLSPEFPVSGWKDCERALNAAVAAASELRKLPAARIADFLNAFADQIERHRDELVEIAFAETGLAKSPRLAEVELPRTSNQLRAAAEACRSGSWALPTIDTANNIRACYEPIGPVAVFGPNNFPFAFGSVSGGDFAAAIAAGNPVIGKANSSHPDTCRRLAEIACDAVKKTALPAATVQLIYRTSHADGERLVADPRLGCSAYTGSRSAGLALKAAADRAGKPIYLELSSVNPVVITPAALRQRGSQIVDDYVGSALLAAGQFCTNPGIVLLVECPESSAFIERVKQKFQSTPSGTLLSPAVNKSLAASIAKLTNSGARVLTGGGPPETDRCAQPNTLLQVDGLTFLTNPEGFQTEAFGNASLLVVADDIPQVCEVIHQLEGNLTGCVYTADDGSDDETYAKIAFELVPKVGRLLNDKMPTGVTVSPAMNHGGPYPATGHPGFTAVGIPASLIRFAKLTSYDQVRQERLPIWLQDKNPTGTTWRHIDGQWTCGDVNPNG
jgi:NADP-dependent aldehyde dehydrogenase